MTRSGASPTPLRDAVKLLKLTSWKSQEERVVGNGRDVVFTVEGWNRIGGQRKHVEIANGGAVPVDPSPTPLLRGEGCEIGEEVIEQVHRVGGTAINQLVAVRGDRSVGFKENQFDRPLLFITKLSK